MTTIELMKLAEDAGFRAAVISAKDIPVDGSFRKFCEDNLCGKYNANYSCPPACGTVEEVHNRLLTALMWASWPRNVAWNLPGFRKNFFYLE